MTMYMIYVVSIMLIAYSNRCTIRVLLYDVIDGAIDVTSGLFDKRVYLWAFWGGMYIMSTSIH